MPHWSKAPIWDLLALGASPEHTLDTSFGDGSSIVSRVEQQESTESEDPEVPLASLGLDMHSDTIGHAFRYY